MKPRHDSRGYLYQQSNLSFERLGKLFEELKSLRLLLKESRGFVCRMTRVAQVCTDAHQDGIWGFAFLKIRIVLQG